MQITRRKLAFFLATLAALVLGVSAVSADDWVLTGTGMRVKSIAFVDIKVYEISHYMKSVPDAVKGAADVGAKKAAVVAADVGKKFVWSVKRDLPQEKVQTFIREAFAMNGYSDQGKIEKYVSAFAGELKEGSTVTIEYVPGDAAKVNVTTGAGSASIDGKDFGQAVWKIYFGKIDPPSLGDKLVSKI